MKKYLSIIVGLMTLPALAFATNDVTINSTNLSVSDYTLVVTGASRTIDSITVNSTNFTVTLAPAASFGVSSSDRRKFTIDPKTSVTATETCTASESSVDLTSNQTSGSVTITITPSTSSTCVGGDGGGGGIVGGGGGGGGGSYTPAAPVTISTTATPAATTPAATTAQPSAVAQAVSPVFNKNLSVGSRSDDVKRLQQLLATDEAIYPEGLATGYYGPATQRAVKAFQKKYDLPQVGNVGPATRAKINEVFGNASEAATPSAVAQTVSPVFNQNLTKGSKSNDVKRLQQLLATDPTIYPEGTVSGLYGSLTQKAVQRFQEKYGVATVGQAGYGTVGPKTRAKIQEVFGQ